MLYTLHKPYTKHYTHYTHYTDLKPENLIFCNDDEVSPLKLADFGLAAKVDGLNLTGKCGTVQFMAPEIIKKELNGKPVSKYHISRWSHRLSKLGRFSVNTTQVVLNEYTFWLILTIY